MSLNQLLLTQKRLPNNVVPILLEFVKEARIKNGYHSINLQYDENDNAFERMNKIMLRQIFQEAKRNGRFYQHPGPQNENGLYMQIPRLSNNPTNQNRQRQKVLFNTHVDITGERKLPMGSLVSIHPSNVNHFKELGFIVINHKKANNTRQSKRENMQPRLPKRPTQNKSLSNLEANLKFYKMYNPHETEIIRMLQNSIKKRKNK